MFNEREILLMNKKLLVAAVAGALALPGAALAQSSVTMSGLFKMSWGQVKIGSPIPARAGTHTSQTRMTDDSSRIVFNVVEDLGGGLRAIGQIDMRLAPDNGVDSGPSGNSHVGLQSKSWGRIFMGRQDLHYFNTESNILVRGDLKSAPWAITSGTYLGAPIANTTRTPNVIHYTTPNWGGFTVIAAYSTNPVTATGNEADIGSAVRKGRGWHLQPNFAGKNWQVGYSYWSAKPDASLADQRADRLYGSYTWGGLKVGLVWDKSKARNAGGVEIANRTAWSIPIGYRFGPHNIDGHYSKARNDKSAAAAGLNTGAKMWAIAYGYDLSKRTSVALTYAQIKNEAAAAYNLFTSTSAAIGTADAAIFAGEDPRILTMTLRHAF
jgi:predicted porin